MNQTFPTDYPSVANLGDEIDPTIGPDLDPGFLKANGFTPVRWISPGVTLVALTNPSETFALDVLGAHLDCPLRIVITTRDEVERVIRLRTRMRVADPSAIDNVTDGSPSLPAGSASNAPFDLMDMRSDDPAAVQAVNAMLIEAVSRDASDVHLEPEASGLRVRYRIDGLLQDAVHHALHLREAIAQRIKVLARMDIAQRLKPQDGAMQVSSGLNTLDVRVSSVPTPLGERIVLRLLPQTRNPASLDLLGMPHSLITLLDSTLKQPNGLVIAAGPTGSGKTTSLYACLRRIDTARRNTITIEDPVEYHIDGVSQLQVGGARQLTFAEGLRSLLRQDPDVIMVGEIRDGDTAGIALRASLTGHLILTSLHTTDPASAIVRLLDLCKDPSLVAETFQLVFDQRLIRLFCPSCHGAASRSTCAVCAGTGFRGRTGLFRMFMADDAFRALIRSGQQTEIRRHVSQACGSMLEEQAGRLIDEGRTSLEEMHRVLEESAG